MNRTVHHPSNSAGQLARPPQLPTVRRLISVWAAAALLLIATAGLAQASPPTTASGTFSQTEITGFGLRFAGPNLILEQTTVGEVGGTLDGRFKDRLRVVIHPSGMFTAQNTITCDCEVAGMKGVIELRVVNTGEPVSPDSAAFAGRAVITGGTDDLSGLRGVFEVEGTVDMLTGLSTFTYTGQMHFHP